MRLQQSITTPVRDRRPPRARGAARALLAALLLAAPSAFAAAGEPAAERISASKEAPAHVPRAQPATPSIAKQPSSAVIRRAALPAPAHLQYDVSANMSGLQYHGQADLFWQHDAGRYEARFEIRALSILLRSQKSSGEIGAGGLQPLLFEDRTRSRNSERSVRFDRAQGVVVFSGGAPAAPLEAGVQDRLSVLMQLALQIASEPSTFRPGAQVVLPTAGPSDVQPWRFDVTGTPTLAVADAAAVRTIKLERAPRDAKDQRVEVWYAPEFDYLPVQLRITQQDGEFVEQRLRTIERGPKKP